MQAKFMHDSSLHPFPTTDAMRAFLHDVPQELAVLGKLPPNLGEEALLQRVAEIALQTLSLLVFSAGLRGQLLKDIVASNCLPDYSAFVVADKYRQWPRWASVTPSVARWVEHYVHVLVMAAKRLADKGSPFASLVASIATRDSTQPLFVRREGDALVPLESADVAANLARWGLRLNDGRRFVAGVLDRAGLDASAESAISGRDDGSLTGGAYGSSSLLVPMHMLALASPLIEAELLSLGLTTIPRKKLKLPANTLAGGPATLPLLRDELQRPRGYGSAQECAIRVSDGFRIAAYRHAMRKLERCQSIDPVSALALLLIFRAGVINREELFAVVEALVRRHAHYHDGRVFVQTRTARLGLREVVLEGPILSFLQDLPSDLPRAFAARLDDWAHALLKKWGGGDLDRLLDYADAAASFVLPGPVREFAIGREAGRTLDLSARARWAAYDDAKVSPRPWSLPGRFMARSAPTQNSSLREEVRPIVAAVSAANKVKGDDKKRTEVQTRLNSFSTAGLSEHASLFLRVLIRVASWNDKPGTLLRYAAPLRALLQLHASRCGEFAEDDAVQNWMEIFERDRAEHADSSTSNQKIRRSVAGFLAAELGIPFERADGMELPAVAIDFMNHADVSRALDQVNALQETTPLVRDRCWLYLNLRDSFSARSDEARKGRSEDFCYDHRAIWFVVNYLSGTATKTGNAGRAGEAVLREAERVRRLLLLITGPLFPSEYIDQVESIAATAQRRATGNATLDAMAMRRIAINRQYFIALTPETVQNASIYERLTCLPRLSRSYGHAASWVTIACYYALLSDNRAQWYAALDASFRVQPAAGLMSVARQIKEDSARRRMPVVRRPPQPRFPPLVNCAPRLDDASICIDAIGQPDLLRYVACRLAGLSGKDAETCVPVSSVDAARVEAVLGEVVWFPGQARTPPALSKDALASGVRLLNEMLCRFDVPLARDAAAHIAAGSKGLELTKERPAVATVHAVLAAVRAADLEPRADFTSPRGARGGQRAGDRIVPALNERAWKHHRVVLFATTSGRRTASQALLLSAAYVCAISAFWSSCR